MRLGIVSAKLPSLILRSGVFAESRRIAATEALIYAVLSNNCRTIVVIRPCGDSISFMMVK
jgi:hypothetical protein